MHFAEKGIDIKRNCLHWNPIFYTKLSHYPLAHRTGSTEYVYQNAKAKKRSHKNRVLIFSVPVVILLSGMVTFVVLWRKGIDGRSQESSKFQLGIVSDPRKEALNMSRCEYLTVLVAQEIKKLTGNSTRELVRDEQNFAAAWKHFLDTNCPKQPPTACNVSSRYASFDGTCNNLNFPSRGSAIQAQRRYLAPMYNDGIDAPRTLSLSGEALPSARDVSNDLFRTRFGNNPDNQLTVFHMSFGQFLDHDLSLTPVSKGFNGSDIECCDEVTEKRSECFSIPIPSSDPHYRTKCMNFVRSLPATRTHENYGQREQLNQVSSYIDASNVYGSSEKEANNLRLFNKGLMKVGHGNGLPPGHTKCIRDTPNDYCQAAGDIRVNVVPNLSSTQLLFVREHNRIAQILSTLNPSWTDNEIFMETRRIIAAMMQHITYAEYLPVTLGPRMMKAYKLEIQWNAKHSYDPNIDASITNVFSTAAFRFGHSQIPDMQEQRDDTGRMINSTRIENVFNRPHFNQVNFGVGYDGTMRWMLREACPMVDRLFVGGVRNNLFLDDKGNSFDLPALNIQRGRDHGLPGYTRWREFCGLSRVQHFGVWVGGLVDHDETSANILQSLYQYPEDIDLYAGAMSEKLLPDGSVGPTFACILGKQFHGLKYGDRFWYQHLHPQTGFTTEQLNEIRKTTISQLICRNFRISHIQSLVFLKQGSFNPVVTCSAYSDIDLTKWSRGTS